MNIDWKKRQINKWKLIASKSILHIAISHSMIFFIKNIFRLYEYINQSKKRIGAVATVWLFFVVSCSFSFPAFIDSELNALASEKEFEIVTPDYDEDLDSVVDEELLLEDYQDTNLHGDNVDLYTTDEILKEKKTKDDSLEKNEAITNGKESKVLDKHDWKLILINKQHPVPEDYSMELATIKGDMKCDARIIDELVLMLKTAKSEGVNLVICSPYRDLDRQEYLFNRKIEAYMKKGMSYMEAYQVSSQSVTVPGASEHQIGLALDIVCDNYTALDEGFGETQAGEWLMNNSHRFGFVLRYPKGKEHITGITYEPWHYRYVGVEAATLMFERQITLEELIEEL